MSKWFLNKKKDRKVYTIEDKRRERQEFKASLDLEPLCKLWNELCGKQQKQRNKRIENYRDFLGIMKGFYGEENPLITKFEKLLNSFEHDCHIYDKTVTLSLDKALEKKRIELKSKQNGEEH